MSFFNLIFENLDKVFTTCAKIKIRKNETFKIKVYTVN